MAIDEQGQGDGLAPSQRRALDRVDRSRRTAATSSTIEYGMGFVNMPFDIPNIRCENGKAMAHTRIGWFRSVSNIPRAFAVQSAVCEARPQARRDPKDFLLELIGPDRISIPRRSASRRTSGTTASPTPEFPIDTARLKRVVNIAAEKAGWGSKLPEREGLGIAAHTAPLRATSRPSSMSPSTRTVPSACRRSGPRSTAASTSIPSASARRSKARR